MSLKILNSFHEPTAFNLPLLTSLSFRDLATFQKYTQPVINAIRNPAGLLNKTTDTASSMSPESLLNRVRNMSTQQMVAAGVVGAEVLGFFTVGEMIGRMKLVGYRGGVAPHGEETPH